MATINVKDSVGSTIALEKPLAPGQAAMATSRPVVVASDQSDLPVKPGSTEVKVTAATIGTGGVGYVGWLSTIANYLAGTLTVATHAVTQSGTWAVNIGTGLTKGAGASDATTARVTIDSGQVGSLVTGDFTKATPTVPMELPSDQAWKTGMSNKVFAAAFSTLTRPANVTAYAAGNSVSDNATAGSVTALSATISDTNDDPIFISDILISSTDTGLAGKRIRAYLFNSDPTASTGVVNGNGAAYSQKKAGYIGSFSGVLETGFSDGTVGRLVPSFNDSATAPVPNAPAGGFVVVKPTAGARTLFIQYQTLDAFTPSANSTTIIGTARGWQARAA